MTHCSHYVGLQLTHAFSLCEPLTVTTWPPACSTDKVNHAATVALSLEGQQEYSSSDCGLQIKSIWATPLMMA
jgi:hypothetical protein